MATNACLWNIDTWFPYCLLILGCPFFPDSIEVYSQRAVLKLLAGKPEGWNSGLHFLKFPLVTCQDMVDALPIFISQKIYAFYCAGEHLWPRSYGLIDGPSLTDLHNIRPADVNGQFFIHDVLHVLNHERVLNAITCFSHLKQYPVVIVDNNYSTQCLMFEMRHVFTLVLVKAVSSKRIIFTIDGAAKHIVVSTLFKAHIIFQ
jgi:mRNA-degrading endonuclease HigB of HigAB toxin-antitoxin module